MRAAPGRGGGNGTRRAVLRSSGATAYTQRKGAKDAKKRQEQETAGGMLSRTLPATGHVTGAGIRTRIEMPFQFRFPLRPFASFAPLRWV
jgi:hypothetical protein